MGLLSPALVISSSSLANRGGFPRAMCCSENLQRSLCSSSLSCRFYPNPRSRSISVQAKKGKSVSEPAVKPSVAGEDDEIIFDEYAVDDGDYFEDESLYEDVEPYSGDGADGGGISLAGTSWDKEALKLAEEVVLLSFEGDLKIYAFRSLPNSIVQVRIEKLSNKSGSPSMDDIEAFSSAYRDRLNKAELTGSIPTNICLEVSSPGVERVVKIPEDLDRFKHRAMHVKYVTGSDEGNGLSNENYGVFRLVSFDVEGQSCTWGLADVRVNREKAGKGRLLNKKQREWQITISFDSLLLVRVYSEA